MISDILENDEYKNLVTSQVKEVINFLLTQNKEFSITANLDSVSFNPELPESIKEQLQQFTFFTLANYTFTTATIKDDILSFEAGFGSENFGSKVKVPLYAIFQVVLDESILYLNPVATVEKYNKNPKQKSLNIFKNNPKNKNLV